MNTFFTSDTHWGHKNILSHQPNRGALWSSLEEHDQALIDNWNSVVGSNDVVYHLGDFALTHHARIEEIRKQLNGKIFLIAGNHDIKRKNALQRSGMFEWVRDYAQIEINDQSIVLLHYAMKVWNKSHYGAWHLYGHSHGSLPDDPNSLSFDVGVDCTNFIPLSFEQVAERMSTKQFVPLDHHINKH